MAQSNHLSSGPTYLRLASFLHGKSQWGDGAGVGMGDEGGKIEKRELNAKWWLHNMAIFIHSGHDIKK